MDNPNDPNNTWQNGFATNHLKEFCGFSENKNGDQDLPNVDNCKEKTSSLNVEELNSDSNSAYNITILNNAVTDSSGQIIMEVSENVVDAFAGESSGSDSKQFILADITDNMLEIDEDIQTEAVEDSFEEVFTKVEADSLEFNEFEIAPDLSSFTITKVFTEAENEKPNLSENNILLNTLTRATHSNINVSDACKKTIKRILKQARYFSSPEYLWLMIQLQPLRETCKFTDEQKKIQTIVQQIISVPSKTTVTDLLTEADEFTSREYEALFHKLAARRHKENPSKCMQDFNQNIMWCKTHLETVPDGILNKADAYKSYNAYCVNRSIRFLKNNGFAKLVRSIYPQVKEKRLVSNSGKQYCYAGIKNRTQLFTPKLPKFAEDQYHNNLLITQYMSCHDCCVLYSKIVLENSTALKQPKAKVKGTKCKPTKAVPESLLDSSSLIHDPLKLLNVSTEYKVVKDTPAPPVIDLTAVDVKAKVQKIVAKKSCCPRRVRRLPSKYKEFKTTMNELSSLTKTPVIDYASKLQMIKDKISRFVIVKGGQGSKFKISCNCCNDVFYVTERHGLDLLSAQSKLTDCTFPKTPKPVFKMKDSYHSSIKKLHCMYDDVILPRAVLKDDIAPVVALNRFEVFDWYTTEINTLKRKLLETALSALNSNSRKSRFEPRVNSDFTTTRHITPIHPPVYISAVRETPRLQEPEPHKITEVYIKHEGPKTATAHKRHVTDSVEASTYKRSKHHSGPLNHMNYHSKHAQYNRRKDSDYIYFPAIDTSPNNLRLANLGTLYKCVLCLMLFNTEQKLLDHEQTHLFCHKCRRKFRDVEVMRQHLIKHCQRNGRKRKPLLKIHKVDSIKIMIKKYQEVFEISKEYYREKKPKKKYREMIKPKEEIIVPTPPMVEEIFISDVKSDVSLLAEMKVVTNEQKHHPSMADMPIVTASTTMKNENIGQQAMTNVEGFRYIYLPPGMHPYVQPQVVNAFSEPPKLIPLPVIKNAPIESTASTQKPFKIRVKDLVELS